MNNNSNSLKFKQQITGQTGSDGAKDVEIIVPLKYLGNFWRTFEMTLSNCEITLQLTCCKTNIRVAGAAANQALKFRITDSKIYVPVVTLSTQKSIKLLKQLGSGFKRTVNWNKYHFKKSSQAKNRYLNV